MEITGGTTVEQCRILVPDAHKILELHGMMCANCIGGGETLENAAQMHDVALDDLIKDLNEQLQNG